MSSNLKKQVIFLTGPTASGKTDLAIELSKIIPADLISVDSALVYKGMDIGTAKPDKETLKQYPHRLVDIRDPADAYSASDFRDDALEAIAEIHDVGRTPILVGGTVLYYKALLNGLDGLPPSNPIIRAKIEARAEEKGWPAVHEELREIDPVTAERLHPHHNQRIQRALEVYEITGQTMTEIHRQQVGQDSFASQYDLRQLMMMPRERSTLHDRIEKRLGIMFEQGLVDEVREMFERGDLTTEHPSVRAVGYRQLWSYFEGDYDLDEAKFRILVGTRKLAKRQLTWFRSWPNLTNLFTDFADSSPLGKEQLVKEALKIFNLNQ